MQNDNDRGKDNLSPENIKKQEEKLTFKEDLKRRLAEVKTTRWIRFAAVSVLLILFVIWIGNPLLLVIWLLLVDIYITAYIPWTWWKGKKGPVRTVMAWVDAIIYALVLVYIIFAFIGQNYKIPSSSLEKSLLVGDYLWVNKMVYGPRVPNTPLHFPLAQHTMPVVGGKSYIENPQLSYHRLPGLRSIERGDIVVFNFPEGDTVLSRMPDEDYYLIKDQLIKKGVQNPLEYIRNNPQLFGEIIVRPVDRRENYVKRAVGLPGEMIRLTNDTVYINGKAIGFADNVQFNYIVPTGNVIPEERWKEIGVRKDDRNPIIFKYYTLPLTPSQIQAIYSWTRPGTSQQLLVAPIVRETDSELYRMGFLKGDKVSSSNYMVPVPIDVDITPEDWASIGVNRTNIQPSYFYYYSVPLTSEMKRVVETWPEVAGELRKENDMTDVFSSGAVWPLDAAWGWSRSNTNEFWIPKRGSTLRLTLNNLPLYRRAITAYEGNKLDVINGKIYINDKPADYYTFKYDYYWMMGDNRDRSLDSRYFGLVPEDHIVGTPMRILISLDEERSLLEKGGIRWNRLFSNPNPDKDKAAEKNWK